MADTSMSYSKVLCFTKQTYQSLDSDYKVLYSSIYTVLFYIEQRSKFTDGAQNFFNILKRVQNFPNRKVQRIATEVLQRNGYFAHQENVLVGILGCNRKEIREMGVETVLSILSNAANTTEDEFRKFVIPKLNLQAHIFYEMSNINGDDVQVPPLLKGLSEENVNNFIIFPLTLNHPCHNQTAESHVKLVTEASAVVSTFEKRDGQIRQKITSRKLMKKFDTKNNLILNLDIFVLGFYWEKIFLYYLNYLFTTTKIIV